MAAIFHTRSLFYFNDLVKLPLGMVRANPDARMRLMDEEREDELLMEAVLKRETGALQRLHDRYHALLHSVAMNVVHDSPDAEEILQDVFLHLWNRAETYLVEKGKPLGWLIMLTRRRAIDRLRQQSSYRRATTRFEAEYLQENDGRIPQVDPPACRGDLRALLEQQLHRLPPAQKQAVELTFFEGMSQREIASATSLPLGTVKTRIELGLRKLANILVTARLKIS
jgi:RNA polymerase sigma-70 factor (ECF subfamily)